MKDTETMSRIIVPERKLVLPGSYSRRGFLRRAGFAAGGLSLLGGVAPNLIVNPVYAGTAVIIDSSGDKMVELSNAGFARAFNIGTWSAARVAIRFTAAGSGALTNLNPQLILGMCSGATNQPLDATTTNFIGLRTIAATWTWTPSYWTVGTGLSPGKKVVATWTAFSAATSLVVQATPTLACLLVHIIKGSPNWTAHSLYYSNTSVGSVDRDTFLAQIVAVAPSITYHSWDTTGNAGAFDEVAGTIDSIYVGWDRSEATIQVTDLAVVKMAA